MIAACDIETRGLDARKFVLGTLITERKPTKAEVFLKKEELWKRILELGESERKKRRKLNLYAHNHSFDFHGYADLNDKNIKLFSLDPFIASYKDEMGKESISFLDSYAIFKMPLKELGNMIGMKKSETPNELKEGSEHISSVQMKQITEYCANDCKIVLESIKFLKDKLKNDGINIQRMYTMNQIAINYMLKLMKETNKANHLFWNKSLNQIRRTFRAKEIHSAYRGGRNECFRTGRIEGVSEIDCNSLYPYSVMNIRFPDLKSERRTERPLETHSAKEILSKIGLSRALIENKSDEIGILPMRTPNGSYYPKTWTYLLGTWTHEEIIEAIENGYELKNIEWSVTFEEEENPFTEIIPYLYDKRTSSGNEFDRTFYKNIMNRCLGKFAQTRVNQRIEIDSVEAAEEYLKDNWKIVKGEGYKRWYIRTDNEAERKPYYAPIIPCLTNAFARIYMYRQFKRWKKEDLIYTDTDSIFFTGENKLEEDYEMGGFKKEHTNEEMIIWGRKTYRIGDSIKVSGIRKDELTPEKFESGYLKSHKMITIKEARTREEAGSFVEETRDLVKQLKTYKEIQDLMEGQRILIDCDIENFEFFTKDIQGITL